MRPIGSSRIGAVFNVSPYSTAADVADALRAPRESGGSRSTTAQDLGHLLEGPLREEYARKIDREVFAGPPYEEPPWAVAEHQVSHPDGWYRVDGGIRLVEIKTLSDDEWLGWGPDGEVPRPDYAVQCVHCMEARHPDGLEFVGADLYAFCHRTGERRLYRIERDKRGAKLVARVGEWYERHVIEAEPVPLTVPAVYVPRDIPAPVYAPATADALAAIATLREARARLRVSEAEEKAAAAALAAMLGTADGFTVETGPVLTYHEQDARRVNPDAVRELVGERPDLAPLLARCFKTSTSRVMRLTKERT